MRQPIIRVRNLQKRFNGTTILDNINLEVFEGEILGIVGSSGSGKTTLLNSISGFVQPDSGDVFFRKKEKSEMKNLRDNIDSMKKTFGFAAQVPSFYENLTVYENMDYFGSLYGLPKESRVTNINILLNLVDLESARDLVAKNLSGGMQRRLDIACALIHDPDVLLLDEPTSDLDPILSRHIWRLLQRINKRGTTIIVASHHFSEIENICSRIGIIFQGKINHVGTITELTKALSKGQEIRIESFPGNYDRIIKNLSDPNINEKENKGNVLIIRTSKPDKILVKLLKTLSDMEETLIDLNISKLNLNDVFRRVHTREKR